MERLGHPVKKLRRVRFGPLKLKGLAVGEWRELTPVELGTLRRASTAEARRVIHRAVVEKRKKAKRKKTGPVTVMGRPLKADPVKRAGKPKPTRSGGPKSGSKFGPKSGSKFGSKSGSKSGGGRSTGTRGRKSSGQERR